MTGKTVLVVGTFDTKAAEFGILIDEIRTRGCAVRALNCGVRGSTDRFPVDYEADLVAAQGGTTLENLRQSGQKDEVMRVICEGTVRTVLQLFKNSEFDGIIGMGGGCGTSIVTAAMRALPLGIPKVCVSTLAGQDVSSFVGTRDIVMIPSLVDLCGTHRLLRTILSQAAGAICGMVERKPIIPTDEKPVVFATMFGNTSECVTQCADLLAETGHETVIFHATGSGGRLMESLISENGAQSVLDLTTTEIADLICGGTMSAGEDRLSAAGKAGLPQVIAPGCLDMVNFGSMESVPWKYRSTGRNFYQWNPNATLMRTNIAENIAAGRFLAQKINAAAGPVAVLFPRKGLSALGVAGQPFCDRQADDALLQSLKENLREGISVIEMENSINDTAFAKKAVSLLIDLKKKSL